MSASPLRPARKRWGGLPPSAPPPPYGSLRRRKGKAIRRVGGPAFGEKGEGDAYINALKSRMNNARLSSNNPAFKIVPLPDFDSFKLKPVYEITAEGLFRVISTGRIAGRRKAKFYKLIELDSGKISFLEGRKELANFFEGTDHRVVDNAINKKLFLQRKITGITYTVEKIY